jgi:hypothetical protein
MWLYPNLIRQIYDLCYIDSLTTNFYKSLFSRIPSNLLRNFAWDELIIFRLLYLRNSCTDFDENWGRGEYLSDEITFDSHSFNIVITLHVDFIINSS